MTAVHAPAFPTAIDPGFTAREYAAIQLRVPNSGTEWLDAMIRKALKIERITTIAAGLLANEKLAKQLDDVALATMARRMAAAAEQQDDTV
ncbi:MAG: hypothetical protein QNJ94_18675 [Alphaproteobacteria bacterium]|nr:hypothetical protein [Alphaproteobacteria bacterium]